MMTFDYMTGQITRDFVFKKIEGSCERTATVGIMCKACPFFGKIKMGSRNKGFVLCKNVKGDDPYKEDEPGCEEMREVMYVKFREEAMIHFYD